MRLGRIRDKDFHLHFADFNDVAVLQFKGLRTDFGSIDHRLWGVSAQVHDEVTLGSARDSGDLFTRLTEASYGLVEGHLLALVWP